MADTMVIAVPTIGEGGLESERSGHFGHCDCFTVIHAQDGEISQVRIVANPPHEEGGCLRPVNLLAGEGVTALVVAGMGARPLAGFADVGISVFYEAENPNVGAAVAMLLAGELPMMDARNVCGGH